MDLSRWPLVGWVLPFVAAGFAVAETAGQEVVKMVAQREILTLRKDWWIGGEQVK